MFPFKVQLLQTQIGENRAKRLAFGYFISQRSEHYSNFLPLIFFSDEANSHLNGHVIKQIMRFWP